MNAILTLYWLTRGRVIVREAVSEIILKYKIKLIFVSLSMYELCEINEYQKRLQIERAFVGERWVEEERNPC